jgi:hypothetical protein
MRAAFVRRGSAQISDFLPHAKVEPVFGQEFPDKAETCSVLRGIGVGVLLDFYNLVMGTPGNQYVWRIPVLCPVKMVFERERLFLPGVRARRGDQDLKCFEFILGLSVPRPATGKVRYFALHTGLGPAHRLAYSPQIIRVDSA